MKHGGKKQYNFHHEEDRRCRRHSIEIQEDHVDLFKSNYLSSHEISLSSQIFFNIGVEKKGEILEFPIKQQLVIIINNQHKIITINIQDKGSLKIIICKKNLRGTGRTEFSEGIHSGT